MEQTRIGLIGVGRFCPNYHIPNLIQRRDVEITAVCDISQDRLDNLPESLGASQTMLDPDLVDGVVVSTPNQYHYEQCKLALERRIPVLVDKPTTVTVAHAKELTTLSQAQECLLMTAFTRRFMASTEYVRSQLASSSDDIQYMTAVQRRAGGNLVDGGMLHTRTVHILDVLPWLVGQRIVAV
ncbi:MAG: Gfo/Idh/MocA family oxidoreductase, partial [Candidatus Latescibacteria bacterium]|nr:Gfo/Idh/MocA family oxidoreductase [Candidatus Latescibacterota bacterium]